VAGALTIVDDLNRLKGSCAWLWMADQKHILRVNSVHSIACCSDEDDGEGGSVGLAIGVWTVLMRWIERKRRWDKTSIYTRRSLNMIDEICSKERWNELVLGSHQR